MKKKPLANGFAKGFFIGEPAGIRTQDTRIKSPVLCLLSYGLDGSLEAGNSDKSTTVSRIL